MALYLTFIVVGLLLFAFVYFYSIRTQSNKRGKTVDPLDALTDNFETDDSPAIEPQLDSGSVVERKEPVFAETGGVKLDDVGSDEVFPAEPIVSAEVNNEAVEGLEEKNDSAPQNENNDAEFQSEKKEFLGRHKTSIEGREEPTVEPASGHELSPAPGFDESSPPAVRSSHDSKADVSETLSRGSNEDVVKKRVDGFFDNAVAKSSSEDKLDVSRDSSPTIAAAQNEAAVGRVEPAIQTREKQMEQHGLQKNTAAAQVDDSLSSSKKIIELVAKIPGENAVSRDDVLVIFRKYDFLFARKLHVFGFNTLKQMWADIEREDVSAIFTDLGVSVQLADKSGALTRKELNTMSQLVLAIAEKFDRQFTFSMDLDEAIENGRELDELGRKHNAMVVLNIVPKRKDGFRSSDIDSCTRDLNMAQAENGVFTRYKRVDGQSSVQYHIAVADSNGQFSPVSKQAPFRVHDVVVYLNVPVVKQPIAAFDTMVDEARKLATWLDGKLVDKHRRNMTTKAIKMLSSQVDEIEHNMRKDGLVPGDDISQKLF